MELKAEIAQVLKLCLRATRVPAGGKETIQRPDIPGAIKLLELQVRLLEMQIRSVTSTWQALDRAPYHVKEAWCTLTRYFADAGSFLNKQRNQR